MRNLMYKTVANERHSITVRTWTNDDGDVCYRFVIDGQIIDEGTISDDDDE